ncbi:hypothetical protein M407DRAFT_5460 [Tulasnella calospora MUT 4182]|uniref:BSD domain-containing protein n=1 Tax=Tulasnella calospora MUT 4182 TaxID=1051891 RepID=A0A0C3MAI5_9AGAM|nr:hypothetical protein M407DRAFT_5460 [Tulasnella calospora MUT 4182]
MNSIDLYEFSESTSGTATPSAASTAAAAQQPSLEEEVNQVVGQLGRFWGGFKRQSTAALEIARKDLSQVVVQAQAELGKISTTTTAASTSRAADSSTDASAAAGSESPSTEDGPSTPGSSTDKGKQSDTPRASAEGSGSPTTPTQPSINSFFSRLQSSLPPQLAPESITQTLQNIQKQVQPALANAQTAASTAALQAQHAASAAASQASQAISQVDVSQYQRSLSGNIRKLQEAQGPMLAQAEKLAEEARHRSEVLLKEAGEYLKDAVKVVPPEGGSAGVAGAWDGSDLWMYPSPIGTAGWGGNDSTKAVEEDKPRKSGDTMTYARVKRADALLARLKHDPKLVKLDPEADEAVRENYLKFVGEEIDGKGGIEGDAWSKKVGEALSDGADGPALKSTMDALVPFEMTEDTFWTRYFFRVHQIQDEEEKRKALLEGGVGGDSFGSHLLKLGGRGGKLDGVKVFFDSATIAMALVSSGRPSEVVMAVSLDELEKNTSSQPAVNGGTWNWDLAGGNVRLNLGSGE